jgi:hypothetical protein
MLALRQLASGMTNWFVERKKSKVTPLFKRLLLFSHRDEPF